MEDGYCENRGDCDNCLRKRYRDMTLDEREYDEYMERHFGVGDLGDH